MTLPAPRRVATMRRLPTLLAAAALALAGLAATPGPARADNDDLIRFLFGAAAVALILRAVDDNARGPYIDHRTLPNACLESVRLDGRRVDIYNSRCLTRSGYRNLPNRCQINFRSDRGQRTGLIASCLYRAGYQAEGYGYRPQRPVLPAPYRPGPQVPRRQQQQRYSLPQQCQMTYRQAGQRIAGYDARCLNRAGIRNLPQSCMVSSRDGQRFYNAACLRGDRF